jgi:hypothetical protein
VRSNATSLLASPFPLASANDGHARYALPDLE